MPEVRAPTNGIKQFDLIREPFQELVLIRIPNRGTFTMSCDEAEVWMSRAGVVPLMCTKLLDYVWNFRRARYVIGTQKLQPIGPDKDNDGPILPVLVGLD